MGKYYPPDSVTLSMSSHDHQCTMVMVMSIGGKSWPPIDKQTLHVQTLQSSHQYLVQGKTPLQNFPWTPLAYSVHPVYDWSGRNLRYLWEDTSFWLAVFLHGFLVLGRSIIFFCRQDPRDISGLSHQIRDLQSINCASPYSDPYWICHHGKT
jgi:hypothetical protein